MAVRLIGTEFTVNDPSATSQLQSSLIGLAGGLLRATWPSAVGGIDFDIRATVFDADGTPADLDGIPGDDPDFPSTRVEHVTVRLQLPR